MNLSGRCDVPGSHAGQGGGGRLACRLTMSALSLALAGCVSLLPVSRQEAEMPWKSFDEARAMFDKVAPGTTTAAELKSLGVDPARTANVSILDHTDLLRRLVPTTSFDIGLLDPGLRECVRTPRSCIAYEIEQTHVERQRVGNFWMDFFNFRREVETTGWQFDAIFVLKDERVIYKLWSGKPKLHQRDVERSPLGPLQSVGRSILNR